MFIKKEAKTKTKLRFCSDFKRKKYTKKGNINFSDAKCIMKLRLNMTELTTKDQLKVTYVACARTKMIQLNTCLSVQR